MFVKRSCLFLMLASAGAAVCLADSPVKTPRPIPATRPEMKELLEDMKQRPYRIPLPELTDKEQEELGERSTNYEARLRYNYVPAVEGTIFGGARPRPAAAPGTLAPAHAPRMDFTRNADELRQELLLRIRFPVFLRVLLHAGSSSLVTGSQGPLL